MSSEFIPVNSGNGGNGGGNQRPPNHRYSPYPNQSPSGYPHSYLNPNQMCPNMPYNNNNNNIYSGQYQGNNNQQFRPQHQNRYFNYQQQPQPDYQQFNPNSPQMFNPGPSYNNNNNNRFHNRSPNNHHPHNHHQHQHHNHHHHHNRHHSPNNDNNPSKKPKIDKRDLPENNQFFCEVCDRGFKTEDKYTEHCQSHKTCGVNGCKFTAAEKLVEIHFRNFHMSGVDRKVSKLETPEDIQKYINDRKKNFPTRGNVETKAKSQDEKFKRGAPLNTRQFGRLKQKVKRDDENNENEANENEKKRVENEKKDKSDEGELSDDDYEDEIIEKPTEDKQPAKCNFQANRNKANSRKRRHNKKPQQNRFQPVNKQENGVPKKPTLLQKYLLSFSPMRYDMRGISSYNVFDM